eukprot:TRINITY_DN37707_c0_g1_i1.p1 TRINITY_DN37707_c0_g1~~TRINITY_DN37707_c0_g1_i1.p1  ORF type:complete len:111 (-),score=21.11 TRINITY_DN37707_c0_g1_i1:174-506(-)
MMKNTQIFLCLAVLQITNGRRCTGRYNVGSYGAVCDYETGQWRTNIAGYPYSPGSGSGSGNEFEVPITTPLNESGSSPSMCEEKCQKTPDCEAWTLNTNNGWCALKERIK